MNTKTPDPKARGRKTLLDATTEREIVNAIRAGAYDWVAAQAAGIARSTFYDWMARGRVGERPFSDFSDKVARARAEARRKREIEVARTNPLAWLRYGPGRERPGEPGWTDSREVIGLEPKSEPADKDGQLARKILEDPNLSRATHEFLAELERVEAEEKDKGCPARRIRLDDDGAHVSALRPKKDSEPP